MQTVAVGLIVGGAWVHVLWTLMPARTRRALARWLLAQPIVAENRCLAIGRPWLRRHGEASGGCGCAGCDAGSPARAGAVAVIRFHRQPPKT
ncbi:MAG: hypothetical protein RLZZ494_780 [Pseudomonadota bacterium]|jgi:hypothetical protein